MGGQDAFGGLDSIEPWREGGGGSPGLLCSGGELESMGIAIGRTIGAAMAEAVPTKLEALECVRGPVGMPSLTRDWFRGDDEPDECGEPGRSVCLPDSLGGGGNVMEVLGDAVSAYGMRGEASGVVCRDLDLPRDG